MEIFCFDLDMSFYITSLCNLKFSTNENLYSSWLILIQNIYINITFSFLGTFLERLEEVKRLFNKSTKS